MKETVWGILFVGFSLGPSIALTAGVLLLLYKSARRFKWNTWPSAIAVWTSVVVAGCLIWSVASIAYYVWAPVLNEAPGGSTNGLILLFGPIFMSITPLAAAAGVGLALHWWSRRVQSHEPQQGVPADVARPAGERRG
jgi:hypothetical protein